MNRSRFSFSLAVTTSIALAAITRAYRLPDETPFLLFAIGRTIGWIAHAMEEYASGHLIRPRARYTGPMPTGNGTTSPALRSSG